MAEPADTARAPSFEEALAGLEAIVERLETGELPLEAALAAFEQGVALSRCCAQQLEHAEQRIAELVRDGGVRPLRPPGAGEGGA